MGTGHKYHPCNKCVLPVGVMEKMTGVRSPMDRGEWIREFETARAAWADLFRVLEGLSR